MIAWGGVGRRASERILIAVLWGCLSIGVASRPSGTERLPTQSGSSEIRADLDAGRYDRAEAAAKARVCSASPSEDIGASLDANDLLVEALWRNGRADAETRALAERAVKDRESPHSLGNLAQVMLLAGQHEHAIRVLEQRLRLLETHGAHGVAVADALDDLAEGLLQQQHRYDDARRAIDRSLQLRHLTPDPEIHGARTLELSGRWFLRRGDYAQSRPLLERSLTIRERFAPDHPSLVTSLGSMGDQLWFEGSVLESAQVYRRALALAERTLRPDHPEIAGALLNLAPAELELGFIAEAVAMQARAVQICDANFGTEHPMLARSLNDLAVGYMAQQDYGRARVAFQRSLSITERAMGLTDESVATIAFNLAFLAGELGDLSEAKLQTARAIGIWNSQLGREHPFVARAWHRLGETLLEHNRTAEGVSILRRSLAMRERALGIDHVDVARTLLQLAIGAMQSGRLKDAEALSTRAVAIWEKRSPNTTGHGTALFLRAETAASAGNLDEARKSYEGAVTIRNRIYGPLHLDVAKAQQGLAKVLAQSGQPASAFSTALEAETAARTTLRSTVRYLPERQAIEYSQLPPAGLDVALSVLDAEANPIGAGRALDALVLGRGVILEEMAARNRSAIYQEPGLAKLWSDVAAARQRLANLAVRTPSDRRPAQYMTLLDAARRDKEAAERALAEKSAEFRQELERSEVGLDKVRHALPSSSGLISMIRYERTVTAQTKTVPHYASFVLVAGRSEPAVVQLGPAAAIDRAVARWRGEAGLGPMKAASVVAAEATYRSAGDRLRQLVWDPLARHLVDVDRVFVVPDGALSLVNLGALPVGASEYLVERHPTIHYLSTERDLVEAPEATSASAGLLALGGPNFGVTPTTPRRQTSTVRAATCGTLQSVMFEELPATLKEATEIAGMWKGVAASAGVGDVYLSVAGEATERSFKQHAPGRRVLHLATHGFFLGGECEAAAPGTRAVGRITAARPKPAPRVDLQNPLLVSGLAFAGANQRARAKPNQEDGILTAEEISAMNLQGTEWAVLSACDTGLGEVTAGEGVFGLRRAFQIAGVRTVIMSLWSVEDEATRRWMRALYDARLNKRLDTAESVRAASLRVLHDRRAKHLSTHPFYWGAFVSAGDWR